MQKAIRNRLNSERGDDVVLVFPIWLQPFVLIRMLQEIKGRKWEREEASFIFRLDKWLTVDTMQKEALEELLWGGGGRRILVIRKSFWIWKEYSIIHFSSQLLRFSFLFFLFFISLIVRIQINFFPISMRSKEFQIWLLLILNYAI